MAGFEWASESPERIIVKVCWSVLLIVNLDLFASCSTENASDCGHEDCGEQACLEGSGDCFPVAGTNPACGALPRSTVQLESQDIELKNGEYRARREGVVAAVDEGRLTLTTAEGDVTITYDLAGHSIPTSVGDEVVLTWAQYRGWVLNTGLALHSRDGALLALADDGKFGSAWVPDGDTSEFGVTIGAQMAGCALEDLTFYTAFRAAVRFVHSSGNEVLVLPGDNAVLDVGGETKYRVFNANYEFMVEARATDVAPRRAWFLLAE